MKAGNICATVDTDFFLIVQDLVDVSSTDMEEVEKDTEFCKEREECLAKTSLSPEQISKLRKFLYSYGKVFSTENKLLGVTNILKATIDTGDLYGVSPI